MNEGGKPNPSGDPGRSGDQSATGDPPAPSEAKRTAARFGAPASGAGTRDMESLSPSAQDRFQHLIRELKGSQARIAELEAERSRGSESQQSARFQSSHADDYNERVAEARRRAEQSFDSNPTEFTKALDEMVSLRAESSVTRILKDYASQQQQEQATREFLSTREKAWEKALADFPALRDENSEFRKAAAAVYEEDPWLQMIPTGDYRAAEIAFARMARANRGTAPRLEGARSAPVRVSPGSLSEMKKGAIEGLQKRDFRALDEMLQRGLESGEILYKDGRSNVR